MIEKVVAVFSSEFLMKTDQDVLIAIKHELEASGSSTELICVVGVEQALLHCEDNKVLLIVDEADYCLLDQ